MKLYLHGKECDPDVEHELFSGDLNPNGFKVKVKYGYGHFRGNQTEFRNNVTEVHWRYPSSSPDPQVAIESDIHHTGGTIYLFQIESLEITFAEEMCSEY